MKITLPALQKVTAENGTRYYVTPEGGRYPSVTTVLSEPKKKQLEKWRKWVGADEANRIKQFCANRGSRFHSMCENYLTQQPVSNDLGAMFNSFKPLLDRISNIQCLEQHLYSHDLKTAGQVDCVAEFDRYPSIIDFKTSTKEKLRDHIWDYFMQAAAYSYMYEERTGNKVELLTIMISCEKPEGTTQLFIDQRKNWIDGFRHYRKLYDEKQIVF